MSNLFSKLSQPKIGIELCSSYRGLDIEFEDEEDEQKIIEQRRKQREELLKVFIEFFLSFTFN